MTHKWHRTCISLLLSLLLYLKTKVCGSFYSLDQMERLLRAGIDVSVIDTEASKNTPLHWAASFGSAVTVQILLEQFGADPNLTNAKGMTALHDAVSRGDPNIVKVLVKFGADPTLASKTDKTALQLVN